MLTIVLGLLFGLLQGIRHAFEPDHVIAVSTMIGEARSVRARVAYAASWGLGHAAMLLLVGVILIFARSGLPPRLDAVFELAVCLMLVALGSRALLHAAARAYADTHVHDPPRRWRTVGPMTMGMIHGLAGSGALTALVVARLPSPVLGVVFMLLFGAGATLGMSLLAGVAGAPLAHVLRRPWGMRALLGTAGALSLSLGLVWLSPAIRHVLVIP
jgi:nickel/cobalt exporter